MGRRGGGRRMKGELTGNKGNLYMCTDIVYMYVWRESRGVRVGEGRKGGAGRRRREGGGRTGNGSLYIHAWM